MLAGIGNGSRVCKNSPAKEKERIIRNCLTYFIKKTSLVRHHKSNRTAIAIVFGNLCDIVIIGSYYSLVLFSFQVKYQ